MRITGGALLLVCLLAAPVAAEKYDVIWLAVGAEELTAPLAPLAEKRKADGYVVRIAKPPVEDAIAALGRPPSVLLLVGDYEPGRDEEIWQLPPLKRPLYKWRRPQRETFSSDALYGDEDGDLVPDYPVGRIPARTPEQVKLVVEKTLAYEKAIPTEKDLRILAWAGAPGYGGAIDTMATGMLVTTVRRFAPAWADRFLVSGAEGNALCGWPPDQPAVFNAEWKKGGVLAAFVAHASDSAVYSMAHEGKGVWYGQLEAKAAFATAPPIVAPVVFLTCCSGEFDEADECLAETLLMLPGGPPVVIAATTESHPLPNLFTGRALLKQMAEGGLRIGRIWCEAQRKAIGMRDFLMERMLRDVEGKLEDEIDVAKLRRDQALIYAIFGDPATRLRMPIPLEVKLEAVGDKDGEGAAGGWRYTIPERHGATKLTVSYRANPAPPKPGAVPPPPRDAAEAKVRLVQANLKESYATIRTATKDEDWSGEFPKDRGPGWYRFVATGPGVFRAAAVEVE